MRTEKYRTDCTDYGADIKIHLAGIAPDEPLLLKQLATRIQVVAVAALSNLRHGKLDPKDELFTYLIRWLVGLNRALTPALTSFEGSSHA